MENLCQYINEDLLDRFEFQSYGHAIEILHEAFPEEWNEIQESLARLSISLEDIRARNRQFVHGVGETMLRKMRKEVSQSAKVKKPHISALFRC